MNIRKETKGNGRNERHVHTQVHSMQTLFVVIRVIFLWWHFCLKLEIQDLWTFDTGPRHEVPI